MYSLIPQKMGSRHFQQEIQQRESIETFDYDLLRKFCATQPKSNGISLNLFIKWQSQKLMIKSLTKKRTNLCYEFGSYGLKHRIEDLSKWLQKNRPNILNEYEYCSNGELIVAMVNAGFNVKNTNDFYGKDYFDQTRYDRRPQPNYYFNYSKLSKRNTWSFDENDWILELVKDLGI